MKNKILTLALFAAIAGRSNATFAGEGCGKCKKECKKDAVEAPAPAPAEGEQAPAAPATPAEGAPAPAEPKAP